MRAISDTNLIDEAFTILKSNAKTKKTMWSRRAQEYETKINSGDIIALSEVVRDLHRNPSQSEQSYSERQLYEQALDRLAKEVSRSKGIKEVEAITNIENQLAKNSRNAAAISAAS
jgi:CarD family transcriptional regulator